MKNKIRRKIFAGVVLTAFAFMNSVPFASAIEEYRPNIRTNAASTALDVDTDVQINNADSIVNLSLRDADITQVLRMFADQAGMNIIFAPSVEGKVTMDLVNITLDKALNLVVNINKLSYDIQDNTLIVASNPEELQTVAGAKNMVMIPVKYVSAKSIATFLNKNIFTNQGGAKPGVSVKPVVSVNPAANELIVMGSKSDALLAQRIVDQFDKKPIITNFKVNHVTPSEMADLICETLIPSVMGDDGGSTGGAAGVPTGFASDTSSSSSSSGDGISVGGGTLVCSVEQKVSENGMESPAFKNMTISYFPTLGTIQVIGGSPTQLEMIGDYIKASDKKSPQAYMEIQMVSLNEEGSKIFQNNWSFYSKGFSFNAPAGAFTPYTAGNSIIFGSSNGAEKWTNSPRLVYDVQYLVDNGKGRVLSNPKLLMTSGQESTIELTSDYIAKTTTQYLDNGSSAGSAQVQKDYDIASDNGIEISITPFISPDGYVTLDIEPDFNEIKETVPDVNGDIAATLLSRTNMELKGVRVKDGETLVIGGLIRESETNNVTKVPFLGDIPVLGMFFRSTNKSKKKEEIVLMLTPQILVDTEDATGDYAL